MITKYQIKKLHTLKTLLSLSGDVYRDILELSFSVDSCTKLSSEQAGLLINDFENSAVQLGLWQIPHKKHNNLANREDMATPKQLRMIEAIWKEVAYKKDREFLKRSLRKFLEKQFRISDPRFLDRSKASKVINGIKSIQKVRLNAG